MIITSLINLFSSMSYPVSDDEMVMYQKHVRQSVIQMSNEELAGAVLMPVHHMYPEDSGYEEEFSKYHIGGVILDTSVTEANVGNVGQYVRNITDKIKAAGRADSKKYGLESDPLIGIDQEFGTVARIRSGITPLPGGMVLGAVNDVSITQLGWKMAGEDLAAMGLNVDFAPDADVQTNKENPIIGSRSFGDRTPLVSAHVSAAVKGLQSSGVCAVLKHFPGHGNTSTDSHKNLAVLQQSLSELQKTDIPPFISGISSGVWGVMVGHLDVRCVDPGVPAVFSSQIHRILRETLGFHGVIFTDSLQMEPALVWDAGEAAVRALSAGNDVLLMPADVKLAHAGILAAINSGRLPRAVMEEKVGRIMALRRKMSGFKQPSLEVVNSGEKQALMRRAAADGIALLRGKCSGPYVHSPVYVTSSKNYANSASNLRSFLAENGIKTTENKAEAKETVHLTMQVNS